MQHRPTAWDRQTEAYTYWRERGSTEGARTSRVEKLWGRNHLRPPGAASLTEEDIKAVEKIEIFILATLPDPNSIELTCSGKIILSGSKWDSSIFTRESSYCFQCVLAIAILSVRLSIRLSVTRVDQSKAMQVRITKSLRSAAWKILSFRNRRAFP